MKLQFNSEDHWTKALRYMLTNLKWGLAFVSTKYMKQGPYSIEKQLEFWLEITFTKKILKLIV